MIWQATPSITITRRKYVACKMVVEYGEETGRNTPYASFIANAWEKVADQLLAAHPGATMVEVDVKKDGECVASFYTLDDGGEFRVGINAKEG
jgi:hypothetical protein